MPVIFKVQYSRGEFNSLEIPYGSSLLEVVEKIIEQLHEICDQSNIFVIDDFLRIINPIEKPKSKLKSMFNLGLTQHCHEKEIFKKEFQSKLQNLSPNFIESDENILYEKFFQIIMQMNFDYIIITTSKITSDFVSKYFAKIDNPKHCTIFRINIEESDG